MKIFSGTVVSVAMQNTVVVEVTRRFPHPLYKKLIKRNKRFKADPAGLKVAMGDKVTISETKKMSKDKYFKIASVLKGEAKK